MWSAFINVKQKGQPLQHLIKQVELYYDSRDYSVEIYFEP